MVSIVIYVFILSVVYASPSSAWIFPVARLVYRSQALYAGRSPRQYRAKKPAPPPPIINQLIKADPVRLLVPCNESESGEKMAGIFSLADALAEAQAMELDLVLINGQAAPAVCKIIDYGKHKYIGEKRKKDQLKKQVKSEMKEVKMSFKIDQHDLEVRIRAAQKFVQDGDHVKVIIQFKGRELQHKELGVGLMQRLFQPLQAISIMENMPKVDGRNMIMILGPKKANTGGKVS